MECTVCERTGDCRFQDLIFEYGSPENSLPFDLVKAPRDVNSRVIVRDPEKCIICGKCVRICDEIQGVAAIGIVSRGLDARVSTLQERPLDCEFCGQCVNACPVGALVARPYTSDVPVWQRSTATTTCSYCSCGCQINVESHEGTLHRVTSDEHVLPNRGKLCAKGWLGWDLLEDPDRLETPLVRRNGRLVPVGWNEAFDAVATGMGKAKNTERPFVALGSSRLTTEDAYLLQRFTRQVAGSPHIDTGPVGGVAALVEGLGTVTGRPRSNASLSAMARADVVLVLRGDPTRTHPLVKTELVQGARQRGQKLILAHGLSGGLERHAAKYLPVEPGSEDVLVHGLAAEILAQRPERSEHLRSVPGEAEWRASIADYTPELVSAHTGVSSERVIETAAMLAEARKVVAVIVTGLGIPGDETTVTRATAWLMSLLSDDAVPALLVLGEKANVQGVVDAGMHPGLLPGHSVSADERSRRELEALWGSEIPPDPGWSTRESLARAANGEVGVLYFVGQDPVAAWPQDLKARSAIERAGFVVVQDAFLTATARLADVVLPVRILGDREGTLIGADGERRSLRRVRTAPLPLPQDGQLLRELARRLGRELPTEAQVDQELERHLRELDSPAAVRRFEAVSLPVRRRARSEMLLDVSPQLFHSGSVTRRSRSLQELAPTVAARLRPSDAQDLGVENGETIRVVAGENELLVRARLDRTVRKGTLVVPWQSGAGDGTAPLITKFGTPITVSVRKSQ
jgi:predicted molibdopterin-dependent oxidoreductase YjgC